VIEYHVSKKMAEKWTLSEFFDRLEESISHREDAATLANQVASLRKQAEAVEPRVQELESRIKELQARIKYLEAVDQLPTLLGGEIRILQSLSIMKRPVSTLSLCLMNPDEAKFQTQNYIDQLLFNHMVELCRIGSEGAEYRLTPKGQKYVDDAATTPES
jgi:predicted RNase H-like nuclease (RuvC/YqgF family)